MQTKMSALTVPNRHYQTCVWSLMDKISNSGHHNNANLHVLQLSPLDLFIISKFNKPAITRLKRRQDGSLGLYCFISSTVCCLLYIFKANPCQ